MNAEDVPMLTREEANALIKAILYLKFDCADAQSLTYAASPLINSSLDKLVAMHGYGEDWAKVFAALPPAYTELVKRKIDASEQDNGSEYDDEVRQLVTEYSVYPYTL
ncbi:hypothetical protein HU720_19045 [Pseudomonas sp. SWRI51]|uniref:hypothetical protein n=1 Tax=Pseudomonas sp. SWRI51 TaxID=2745491 RepID=UPI00164846AF|nr:hypothetical protein [Pseudomonas sp. SWRI51]MBC3413391.1 hypothetical protein [Pseudomonas sp. SWRI51]